MLLSPTPRHITPTLILFCATIALPSRATAQRAPAIPVEIFAGRMNFANDLGLRDQELAGIRTGFDLLPYLGVRGFYWRGIDDDHNRVDPLQAFGAEGELSLNGGHGLTPFLTAGYGRLDFMDGYRNADSIQPADRGAAIVGAGLRMNLGRFGASLSARSWLFQTDSLDRTTSDDLKSNFLIAGGLSVRLGGSPRPVVLAPTPEPVVVERRTRDTVYVSRAADEPVRVEGAAPAAPEHMVTIPVPREGELYVRYGSDSSSMARALRTPAQTTVVVPDGSGAPRSDPQAELLRLRLMAQVDSALLVAARRNREGIRAMIRDELARQAPARLSSADERRLMDSVEVVVARRLQRALAVSGDTTFVRVAVAAEPGRSADGFRARYEGLRPYMGYNGGGFRQFVVGTRVDLGTLNRARPSLRVLPELAMGIGQAGVSALFVANVQNDFRTFRVKNRPFAPYVYAGLGLLFVGDPPAGQPEREAVLNLGYGVQIPLRAGSRRRLFLEHQGIDLFDLHRLLIGVRM